MLQKGQILLGKIEALGSRGEGILRYKDINVFVHKTNPGDEVEIKIIETKGRQARASLLRVLSPSPSSREPLCSHFHDCGGCDFQNLPYELQLEWKKNISQHWINRSPLKPFMQNVEMDLICSPREFQYRHRVRVQIKEGRIAFLQARSHQPVFLQECPILVEGFWESLKSESKKVGNASDRSFLFTDGRIQEESFYLLDGYRVPIHRESFSQPNLFTNELMWKRIKQDLESLKDRQKALDLFCGSGNFSFGLKTYFYKVSAIEQNPLSIKLAQKQDPDIDWHCGRVEEVLEKLLKADSYDFVLLDPSREGAKRACEILGRYQPSFITYVSCQLDTLIRDLTHLVKKSGYKIRRWTVVDLLPQTKHIESIVSLEKST